jgi:hypothetical protein
MVVAIFSWRCDSMSPSLSYGMHRVHLPYPTAQFKLASPSPAAWFEVPSPLWWHSSSSPPLSDGADWAHLPYPTAHLSLSDGVDRTHLP